MENAPAAGAEGSSPEGTLRAGALRLPSVLMQGITHIAPAVALLVFPFIAGHAGAAMPLAFAIAFVFILMLGLSLTQLARKIPSAGGYYEYVSRTVHPRAGFLTAWLYFLYDPTVAAINIAFLGSFLESALRGAGVFVLPWWGAFLIAVALISFLAWRGIEVSSGFMVVLGAAEILIVLALGATGLVSPGPGGAGASFSPSGAPSARGLAMGVVFAILSFTGFESVAPLAEESEDPRKNLPRAIVRSIL